MKLKKKKLQNKWELVKLKDIAEIGAGNSAPQGGQYYEDGKFPFIRTQDVGRLHINPALTSTTDYVNELAIKSRHLRLFPKKVLLIPKSGASTFLNHRVMTNVPAYVSSHLAVIIPNNRILPEYLYFWSLTIDSKQIAQDNYYPSLRLTDLEKLELLLPPLQVQEKIVEILQKIDEIQHKRKEALEISEEILPAIYRDLFGDPEVNPNNWPIEELGNSIEESNYGTSEKSETFSEGTPVLRIPNVIGRMININDIKFLKVNEKERKRYLLSKGDVLIVRTNGNRNYVGRCAVFDLENDYLFASYLIRIRIKKSRLDPHYVIAFFSTPYGRKQINMKTRTSAGQYNLSLSSIKEIEIPIPPLSRQEKFLNEYRQWELTKSRLEQNYIEAENTFKSILKEAFSGRLTAEWEAVNGEWIKEQISK